MKRINQTPLLLYFLGQLKVSEKFNAICMLYVQQHLLGRYVWQNNSVNSRSSFQQFDHLCAKERNFILSGCSHQQQSVILITENTQKVEEKPINGINYSVPISISGHISVSCFQEFRQHFYTSEINYPLSMKNKCTGQSSYK